MNEADLGQEQFESELKLQQRAESMLMLRSAAILLVVSVLVAIRSLLL